MCVVSLSFHFIGTQERLSSSSTELRKKKASTAKKKAGQQNFMSRKISLVVQKERETEETEIPLFSVSKIQGASTSMYRVALQVLY